MMMWGITLILFVSSIAAQVAPHGIKMDCQEVDDFAPRSDLTPSLPADLKVNLVTDGGRNKINISWAINIDGFECVTIAPLLDKQDSCLVEVTELDLTNTDASIDFLNGTRIIVSGSTYDCEYIPRLARVAQRAEKIWFHYVVSKTYGMYHIQVGNLPQQRTGLMFKVTSINVPRTRPPVRPRTFTTTTVETTRDGTLPEMTTVVPVTANFTSVAMAIFGVLASLMILSSCYIIYKRCGARFATSLGFKMLPASPADPVPVLVVYPAENLAFQRAVVALVEFLQWDGGCSVAVDMWQQGKIAELGPMRWLAEQAKAADRVLIVCPQPYSQPSDSPPNHDLPEPSIPAAAHDLYPLILNMVASHAKSTSDLAKFWVVQLGRQQDKKPSNLAPELRACKTFCLMKDLNKLCRSLHTQRENGRKISDLIFKPVVDKSAMKLREAVENLGGRQPSIVKEVEPLTSVATTI